MSDTHASQEQRIAELERNLADMKRAIEVIARSQHDAWTSFLKVHTITQEANSKALGVLAHGLPADLREDFRRILRHQSFESDQTLAAIERLNFAWPPVAEPDGQGA